MRTFIAVEFSDDIRQRLAAAQERLRGSVSGVKWVEPGILHLTLKFLGEIDEGAVDGVAGAMADAAAGVSPFEVRVAGLGAFPPHGAPRVVWAGLADPSGSLQALHDTLDRGLEPLGIEPEGRPFTAHLTIGRVKEPRGAQALRALIEKQAPAEFGVQRVEELVLFRSVLSSSGPTYTPLRRHPFQRT